MSIHLFMGQEFEHSHEMRALRQFLEDMQKRFGASDQYYFVFVNYFIHGQNVDLTVLKERAIIVIELKECGDDPISGTENGDWVIRHRDGTEIKMNPGRKNPFQQAEKYRFAWINLLNEKSRDFLPPQKAHQMAFDYVSAFVALSPRLNPSSQIEINFGRRRWFKVIGLDKLCPAVYDQRSPELSFTEKELTTLAEDVLRLKRVDVEEFLQTRLPGAPPTRVASETPVSAEQWRDYCQSLIDDHDKWTELFVPLEALKFVPTRLIPVERTGPFPSMPHLRGMMPTPQPMPVAVPAYVRRCESPLVLLGDPGQGKTAAVELLAVEYARRRLEGAERLIPVLVKLNKYDQQQKRGLQNLIAMSLRARGLQVDAQQVEQLLGSTSTPLLLMFDGLDEVKTADRTNVKQDIESLLMNYPVNKYIITCRRADYDRFELRIEGEQRAKLSPFDKKNIRRFLVDYYWRYEQDTRKGRLVFEQLKQQGLLDFAQIPLHLGLIVGIAGEAGELPANRGELYQRFVDKILRLEAGKGTVSSEWEYIERFLAHLALVMQEKETLRIGKSEARKAIGQYWRTLWDIGECSLPRDRVFNLVWNSRLLVRTGAEAGFRHPVFQEYFVAKRLAYMLEDSERDIYHYVGVPRWDKVFVFLAGLMDDASDLLCTIPNEADPMLALKCLANARKVSSDTRMFTIERILDRLSAPGYLKQHMMETDVAEGLSNAPDDLMAYLVDGWTERILSSDIPLDLLLPYIRFVKSVDMSLAEQKLLAALKDLDHESERLRAAELLAYLGSEESVQPLIACLEDGNPDLRISAIEALGRIGDLRVVETLKLRLFDSDSGVRRTAVTALGSLCGADASPPPTNFLAALRLIAPRQKPDSEEVEEVKKSLRLALLDSSAEVRTEAAIVLGCLGDTQVADQLIGLLMDVEFDYYQKGRVARALGYIGTEEAVGAIKEFSDADVQVNSGLGIIEHYDLGNPIGFECAAAFFLSGNTSAQEWLWLWLLDFITYRIGLGTTAGVAGDRRIFTWMYRLDRWRWYQEKLVPTIAAMGPKAVVPLLECISESDASTQPRLVESEAYNLLGEIGKATDIENLINRLVEASQISDEVEGAIWLLWTAHPFVAKDLLLNALRESEKLVDLFIEAFQKARWMSTQLGAVQVLAQFVQSVGKDTAMGAKVYHQVVEPAKAFFLGYLDEKDDNKRYGAASFLLPFYADERVVGTAIEALHDATPELRIAIATALKSTSLDRPKIIAAFADALQDPEREVRERAAEVLHDKGDESVVEALVQALDDEEFLVRHEVIRALGKIGDHRAVGALTDILCYHEDEFTRRWAAEALGELGSASVIPSLVKALADSEPKVQQAAAHATGKIGELETAKPLLLEVLETESPNVQYWVAITLVWLKDPSAVELCIQALDCNETEVREEALDALVSAGTDLLDGNRLLETCAGMLEDEDGTVRSCAVRGLGQVSSSEAIALLRGILESGRESNLIRLYAVGSLANIGTSEAVGAIIKVLNDPDATVRYAAITVLGKIGDARALPALARMIEEDTATFGSVSLADGAKKAIEQIQKRCGE